MSQLLFLRHLASSLPRVALGRARRGPLRPSWSFGFELIAMAMKRTGTHVARQSWVEQRRAYDSLANKMSPTLRRVTRDTTVMGGVPCEWFSPHRGAASPARPGEPVILYFHGGAYIFGSTTSHAELISRIGIAAPARVLAPNYRLAPEHPFPAAIDDAVAVYRALVTSGIEPSRIVVGGDSAGGGLTMALLLRLREAGEPLPRGAFLICPWVDLSARGGSIEDNEPYDWATEEMSDTWTAAYLGSGDRRNPFASPALADLHGLPPLLVQAGEAELLLDQATHLARRAEEAGVDVRLTVEPDMIHDWHSFAAFFPSCQRSIDEIGSFVRDLPVSASKTARASAATVP